MGGEIVYDVDNHPEPTATWMGSGHFPSEGWQHASYMRNLMYQSDAAGTMLPVQPYPSVTNPTAYQIATDFSGTTNWGSNFYWGDRRSALTCQPMTIAHRSFLHQSTRG